MTGERYDYEKQAWIGTDGRWLCCAHPAAMDCRCYGKLHAGELAQPGDREIIFRALQEAVALAMAKRDGSVDIASETARWLISHGYQLQSVAASAAEGG